MDTDGILSLSDVKTYTYDKKHNETDVKVDYVDLVKGDLTKASPPIKGMYVADDSDKDTWAIAQVETWTSLAHQDTVFYYVNLKGEKVTSVKTVTGYKNTVAVDAADINAMYAVATNTGKDAAGENCWVADVVVIEAEQGSHLL